MLIRRPELDLGVRMRRSDLRYPVRELS